MNLNQTLELFKNLLSKTEAKSEKKIYNCFINTLDSLKDKELSASEYQLIEEKLSSLHLNEAGGNKRRFYRKKQQELKVFLQKEFSFTTENYYSELWMILGMCFGTGIGLTIGVSIDPAIGTSVGLSCGTGVGMMIGMLLGSRKDKEAKELNRII